MRVGGRAKGSDLGVDLGGGADGTGAVCVRILAHLEHLGAGQAEGVRHHDRLGLFLELLE